MEFHLSSKLLGAGYDPGSTSEHDDSLKPVGPFSQLSISIRHLIDQYLITLTNHRQRCEYQFTR